MSSSIANKKIGKKNSLPRGALRDDYIPFNERFLAWWHGRTLRVPMRENRKISVKDISTSYASVANDGHWGPARLKVLSSLWGENFIEPGGFLFARNVLSPLDVDSKKTVLDLTAGLGGNARMLANEYNLWMEAFESDAKLAAAAHKISERNGLAARVPVKVVNMDELVLRSGRYDNIYSRERLYEFANKGDIIEKCAQALKPKGQFFITDITLASESGRDNDYSVWMRGKDKQAHPWTKGQYLSRLKECGFSIWTKTDLSKQYVDQINLSWMQLAHELKNGNFDRDHVNMLMDEGEIWLKRSQDIREGKLEVTRFFSVLGATSGIC